MSNPPPVISTGPPIVIFVPAVGDVEVYPVYVDGEIVRSFSNPRQQVRHAQMLASQNGTTIQAVGGV